MCLIQFATYLARILIDSSRHIQYTVYFNIIGIKGFFVKLLEYTISMFASEWTAFWCEALITKKKKTIQNYKEVYPFINFSF